MKKVFSMLIFLTVANVLFAVTPSKWNFTAGLSSGIPFYGKDESKCLVDSIENPNRIVVGTFINANLNPIKNVTFYTGAELLSDLCWNSNTNANFFHTDFPLGVKIFPNLGGFNLGLAYTLGFCTIATKSADGTKHADTTPWGNGFIISTEYDFSRTGKSKYYPTLGLKWKHIPRGYNSVDNLLVFYLGANF